jgi:hypothetical protein
MARKCGIPIVMVAGLAFASTPGIAQSDPSITIVQEQSEVTFVSCKTEEPFIRGTIAIKNTGSGKAYFSWIHPLSVRIYVPTAPDLEVIVKWYVSFSPGQIASKPFEIGKGIRKQGRSFSREIHELATDVMRVDIQSSALQLLGFSDNLPGGKVEKLKTGKGDIDAKKVSESPEFKAAVKRFQRSLHEKETGVLSSDQRISLLEKAKPDLIKQNYLKYEADEVPLIIAVGKVTKADTGDSRWIIPAVKGANCQSSQ